MAHRTVSDLHGGRPRGSVGNLGTISRLGRDSSSLGLVARPGNLSHRAGVGRDCIMGSQAFGSLEDEGEGNGWVVVAKKSSEHGKGQVEKENSPEGSCVTPAKPSQLIPEREVCRVATGLLGAGTYTISVHRWGFCTNPPLVSLGSFSGRLFLRLDFSSLVVVLSLLSIRVRPVFSFVLFFRVPFLGSLVLHR